MRMERWRELALLGPCDGPTVAEYRSAPLQGWRGLTLAGVQVYARLGRGRAAGEAPMLSRAVMLLCTWLWVEDARRWLFM